MAEDVELRREGVKLSYRRLLSDSTPGYLLLLLGAYHAWPHLPEGVRSVLEAKESAGTVFVYLVLLLAATPLGLMLNAITLFLPLGFAEIGLSGWLFAHRGRWYVRALLWGTRRESGAGQIAGVLNAITRYDEIRSLRELLVVRRPDLKLGEHMVGLQVLFRSLAAIAFVESLFHLSSWWAAAPVGVGALFVLLAAFIDAYVNEHYLLRIYASLRRVKPSMSFVELERALRAIPALDGAAAGQEGLVERW